MKRSPHSINRSAAKHRLHRRRQAAKLLRRRQRDRRLVFFLQEKEGN